MELIDKAAVVADIDELQNTTMDENKNFLSSYHEGIFDGLSMVEHFINTLKVKEVDLEKESLTWEDINDLEAIMNEVHSDFRNGIGQKSFGLEVLERFLYNKDYEDLDVKSPKFKGGDEIRSIDGQYKDTVLEVLSDGSYRLKNLGLLSIPENEWELVNAPVNGYELIDKKRAKHTPTTLKLRRKVK